MGPLQSFAPLGQHLKSVLEERMGLDHQIGKTEAQRCSDLLKVTQQCVSVPELEAGSPGPSMTF